MTRSSMQKIVAVCVSAAVMCFASTASAQWGEGVRGGGLVIHPGLSLSAGFDSNLYYSSARDDTPVFQAPEGLIEPRLSIHTEDTARWDLSGQAGVGWRHYFSDEERVRNQSGLSANLDANLHWNADGAFSLQLRDEFVRTTETPNSPSRLSINRIYNNAGIMAGLHPGGRVLEMYGSYDFALYRHSQLVASLDRDAHKFGWHAHWSFLPKTALVAEVDHRRIRYYHPFQSGPDISPEGELRNVDSNPVRLRGGLEGLITTRLALGARAGYGWARYTEGPDTQGVLGEVELSYQFGNVENDNRIRAGYRRDFSDSTVGNFYTSDRFLVGYEQGMFDNRFRLGLEADAQIRNYAEIDIDETATPVAEIRYPDEIADLVVGLEGRARFEIRNGWDIAARYRFGANYTDDIIEIERVAMPGEVSVRDYYRHHVLLSTELTY